MRSATAEVMAQRLANCVFVGIGIAIEQGCGGDDHAVQAISALSRGLVDKGRLDRMQTLGCPKAFKCDDTSRADRTERHRAGPDGTAVYENGASTAFAEPATVFRTIQGEIVSEDIEKWCFRACFDALDGVVHIQTEANWQCQSRPPAPENETQTTPFSIGRTATQQTSRGRPQTITMRQSPTLRIYCPFYFIKKCIRFIMTNDKSDFAVVILLVYSIAGQISPQF